MNKLIENKYMIGAILTLPIFYYIHNNDYLIWKFINKHDKYQLFKPIWKYKFNNYMNTNAILLIIQAIKTNKHKNEIIKLRDYIDDIYYYEWKPNYKNIKSTINNDVNLSEKKMKIKFANHAYLYFCYDRIILNYIYESNNIICLNIDFD